MMPVAESTTVEWGVYFEDSGDRMVLKEPVARSVVDRHTRRGRKVRLETRLVTPWAPVADETES